MPALALRWRLLILAIAVAHFLFGHGWVGARYFDWDRSILYSYLPIPFLVAIALALTRRWGLRVWLLHTLEIVCAKFAVTALILIGVMIAHDR